MSLLDLTIHNPLPPPLFPQLLKQNHIRDERRLKDLMEKYQTVSGRCAPCSLAMCLLPCSFSQGSCGLMRLEIQGWSRRIQPMHTLAPEVQCTQNNGPRVTALNRSL